MLKFNAYYFALTVLLFLIEVGIALFVHDAFIRPYFGDFLVVVLIYCFIRAFSNLSVRTALLVVLVFSFAVEFSQHLGLIKTLGLQDKPLAKALLGNSFSWMDLALYLAGIVFVYAVEHLWFANKSKKE